MALRGLQRRCNIWKNGISWTDSDSITTVLELNNKNRWVLQLVAMSCNKDSPVEHAKLHCVLNSLFHNLHREHCPSLEVCECLISLSLIQQYSLNAYDLPETDLFDIHHVVDSIVRHKLSIPSQNEKCITTSSAPLLCVSCSTAGWPTSPFQPSALILQEIQKHFCQPSKSPLVCKELKGVSGPHEYVCWKKPFSK